MKKRNTYEIIFKAVMLDCDAVLHSIRSDSIYSKSAERIINAAQNELNRLQSDIYKKGFSDGYDAGFECAEIASKSIIIAQEKFDEITDPQTAPENPSNDLAHPNNAGAGSVHPLFSDILKSIAP